MTTHRTPTRRNRRKIKARAARWKDAKLSQLTKLERFYLYGPALEMRGTQPKGILNANTK